jgi:inositol transport system permease protein
MDRSINVKEFAFKYGMMIILVLLFIFFSMLIPKFASIRSIFSILEQVSMFGVISIGVTFVIITQGIDLSSGSVVALTSVVCASIVGGEGGAGSAIFAFFAVMSVGALCGLINGSFTAFGGIPPFIATLGMMTVARGAASLYSGGRPIDASSDAFTAVADFNLLAIPGLVWIYIIVGIISTILLSKTKYGRHVYAIGGNRNASKICGINVKRTLIVTYGFAGALAGLAGAMLTSRTYAGNPAYGNMWELDAIAATVIGGTSLSGGKGSVVMCMVGALIIGVINKGLNGLDVNPYWQQIVKGGIIIGAVLLDTLKSRRST